MKLPLQVRGLAIAGLILSWFACTALSEDAAAPQESEKLKELKKQRAELQEKMHQKRLELISKDEELKKLHEKVLAVHREMALILDKNKEMKPLVDECKKLEAQIRKLEELAQEGVEPVDDDGQKKGE